MRPAVRLGRQVHPVPVHARRLVEGVGHLDPNVLTAGRAEGGAEASAVEAPALGADARSGLRSPLLCGQLEHARPVGLHPRRRLRWDRQRSLELDLVNRRHRREDHEPHRCSPDEGEDQKPEQQGTDDTDQPHGTTVVEATPRRIGRNPECSPETPRADPRPGARRGAQDVLDGRCSGRPRGVDVASPANSVRRSRGRQGRHLSPSGLVPRPSNPSLVVSWRYASIEG